MKNNILYTNAGLTFTMAVCILLNIACTGDFDKINRPRTPTEEEVKGDFYYIGVHYQGLQNSVILAPQNRYQHAESLSGQSYGRYLTITKDNWNQTNYGVFNAPNSWLNNLFNFNMTDIHVPWFELKRILTEEDDKAEHYTWAWAELLRVAAAHRMTDTYGPIPYSKIKENTGSLQVAYDSQEDVYKGMFADLNKSIAILTEYVQSGGASEVSAFKDYDKVYGGDFAKWLKFANSLKLRMAMRLTYVNPTLAEQYAREALTNPGGVITTNEDNATLKYFPNPLYIMGGAYADSRACAEIMSYLKGYEDPRISSYFLPSVRSGSTKYEGMRLGIRIPSHEWASGFSAPRVAETDPLLWMGAAEVAFLKAEGKAVWNWDFIPETAEELYNQGIRLSFAQWNLGEAQATAYLNDDSLTPSPFADDGNAASAPSNITIKWNEAASKEEKQERIITQKWIAIYPLGHEAWAEQRRTGYPRIFPTLVIHNSDQRLRDRGASRIPYAPQEAMENAENHENALQLLGSSDDDYGTRLWWDKKPGKPNF